MFWNEWCELQLFFFSLYQASLVRDVTWWMLIVRFQVMCTTPYLRFEKQTSASSWNSSPSPFLSDVPPEPNGLWKVWQDVIYRRQNVCSVNCRVPRYIVKKVFAKFYMSWAAKWFKIKDLNVKAEVIKNSNKRKWNTMLKKKKDNISITP